MLLKWLARRKHVHVQCVGGRLEEVWPWEVDWAPEMLYNQEDFDLKKKEVLWRFIPQLLCVQLSCARFSLSLPIRAIKKVKRRSRLYFNTSVLSSFSATQHRIQTFFKNIIAMWNANSLVKGLNMVTTRTVTLQVPLFIIRYICQSQVLYSTHDQEFAGRINDSTKTQSAGATKYTDWISAEGLDSPNEYLGYDTKQSDGEASVILMLWKRGAPHCYHHS